MEYVIFILLIWVVFETNRTNGKLNKIEQMLGEK